jgi:hypothetical protein
MIHTLIGKAYELGADGSGDKIDCIHLVYTVLKYLNIPTIPFNQDWYSASSRQVIKDLRQWGCRVPFPLYDGDVTLDKNPNWAFGVVWEGGILYINHLLQEVAWTSLANNIKVRCYRSRSI